MTNYIPINEQAEGKVERALKKQKIFADVEQFIMTYNSGLINTGNDSIKKLADLVNDSYLNILLQNRRFFVQSETEVNLRFLTTLIEHWSLVAVLKRVADELIEADYSEDTKLIFIEDRKDQLFLDPEEPVEGEDFTHESFVKYEDLERVNLGAKKLASNIILKDKLKNYPGFEDVSYIEIRDLAYIDDEPIKTAYEAIASPFDVNETDGEQGYDQGGY